jgi:nitrous oxidase accessory protein NosD
VGESLQLIDGVFDVTITDNRVSGAQVRAIRMEAMNGVVIRRNEVDCGTSSCAFFFNPEHVSVTENRFRSAGSISGLHFQGFVADIEVSRNHLLATAPSTVPVFGAIRIRDTSGAHVLENVIEGPWANGLALTLVDASDISSNRVQGAVRAALALTGQANTVTGNWLQADGTTIVLSEGCRNVMRGNTGSGGQGPFLYMAESTGANTAYLTGPSPAWIDEGSFDCDGDGLVDPNLVVASPRLP